MEPESAQKRFLWGVILAWIPWVPILIGLGYAFRGIGSAKATGIAAVAGGLGEGFVLWGIVAMVIGQTAAIVLLVRVLSNARWMRSLVSVLSICMSALMLILVGGFLVMIWHQH